MVADPIRCLRFAGPSGSTRPAARLTREIMTLGAPRIIRAGKAWLTKTRFRWYALVTAHPHRRGVRLAGGHDPSRRAGARNVSPLVEPGPLTITILKRDQYLGEDTLTADFDPLGQIIATLAIPDDGVATKADA